MNPGLSSDHVSIHYYDGDYPSADGPFRDNFDETTVFQGIASDIQRYREIASETEGEILELCCGTGRIAIPLARAGRRVTAVDISSGMLRQLEDNLRREERPVAERITLVEQDISRLDLRARDYGMGIIGFNSLLCIPDFEAQLAALRAIGSHLAAGAPFVVDVVNPLKLNLAGDPHPKLFFTRKNPHTGDTYSRFAMSGPLDADQRQRLHGWYDELAADGTVRRRFYSMHWRPIFRFELELMLRAAGFRVASIEGGHKKEPLTADSDHLFVVARKGESAGRRAGEPAGREGVVEGPAELAGQHHPA
jgi:SAM-dependent methyltransferase